MKLRASLCSLAVFYICLSAISAQEAVKSVGFNDAVVRKAIGFMPEDQRTKLAPLTKSILEAMKPDTPEACYFTDKNSGKAPSLLAEQFRIVRNGVAEKKPHAELAPSLGKIALLVISLSQPYHSTEASFALSAHAEFEKGLDASSETLKADFDKFEKVADPADFSTKLAKKANGLLSDPGISEKEKLPALQSAVFSLAANGTADCWWTLLVPEVQAAAPTATGTPAGEAPKDTGGFIGNKNSHKFHKTTCRHLPAEANRVPFGTRDEAINQGYTPCKVCKP